MKKVIGDITKAPERIICHGVNLVGPSNGLAAVMWDEYPEAHQIYLYALSDNHLYPGGVLPVTIDYSRVVFNLANQIQPGANCEYDLVLKSLRRSAFLATRHYDESEIAVPKLGCGIGGLEWKAVKHLIKAVEEDFSAQGYPVEFVVYSLN